MPILTGAKTLCIAYATTKVPAFDATFFENAESVKLKYSIQAITSRPLKTKNTVITNFET